MPNLVKTRMLAMITNEITQVNMQIRNFEECLPRCSEPSTCTTCSRNMTTTTYTDIIVELVEYRNMLLQMRKQVKEGSFSLC
jgi:hypothetical protein